MQKTKITNQKGALFGLDARITMMIITILGLITATFFRSVVSKAKSEAVISTVNNVNLAIESYIEDTGSIPNIIYNLYDTLPTKSTQSGEWSGPYLQGFRTGALVPRLTWTLTLDNCESATASRYCTYSLAMTFSDMSEKVFTKLKDYYHEGTIITHDNALKELTITYIADDRYKVKEKP
ncbi:MAG: hypothetical protein GY793_07870 [Proteobacteria bacterium]|nr:hypothetical protein [Pseudomonadota bacterium]